MEADKTTRQLKQDIIDAAFAHVYPTAEALVEDVAREHALANMGQSLIDYVHLPRTAPRSYGHIVSGAFEEFYQSSESEETAACIQAERKAWLKDAKRDVKRVQKAGLPLTMASARDAFENKGAFAKKK